MLKLTTKTLKNVTAVRHWRKRGRIELFCGPLENLFDREQQIEFWLTGEAARLYMVELIQDLTKKRFDDVEVCPEGRMFLREDVADRVFPDRGGVGSEEWVSFFSPDWTPCTYPDFKRVEIPR